MIVLLYYYIVFNTSQYILVTHHHQWADWTESCSQNEKAHLVEKQKQNKTPCFILMVNIDWNNRDVYAFMVHWSTGHTCDDHRGPLCGLLSLLDSVLVHLVLYLLQFVHGIQTISPPFLLDRLAYFCFVSQFLCCLDDLPLQSESALQVPQEGILHKWWITWQIWIYLQLIMINW